jgi:hypothetical protein
MNELIEVLPLAEPFSQEGTSDEDREVIRAALRKKLHWHRNYDDTSPETLESMLNPVELLYQRLEANDLCVRHRWLFSDHWPQLPTRTREEDYSTRESHFSEARLHALNELQVASGMAGIERMVQECAHPETVGATLAEISWDETERANWIIAQGGSFPPRAAMTRCISGLLHWIPSPQSTSLINLVISKGLQLGWTPETIARLMLLTRFEPETWNIVDAHGDEAIRIYWSEIFPGMSRPDGASYLGYVLRHLLEVARPRAALHYCEFALEQTDARLLFEMLQRFVRGEEPDGHRLESWRLGEMLGRLEKSGEIEKMELVRLEFQLFPALTYGQESSAASLYEAITSEAALFCELICLFYKPEHGESEEPVTEATRSAAVTAWSLLRHCARQPGTRHDGSIDHDAFTKFISDARELCRQADRLTVCDARIGEILAHAPADEDGQWPFAPARLILDQPEMEEMRRGFHIGTRNKRGVTSRGMLDGGEQERALASQYRRLAEPLHTNQPYVAALLEEIARSYERDGEREDIEANLRREGY